MQGKRTRWRVPLAAHPAPTTGTPVQTGVLRCCTRRTAVRPLGQLQQLLPRNALFRSQVNGSIHKRVHFLCTRNARQQEWQGRRSTPLATQTHVVSWLVALSFVALLATWAVAGRITLLQNSCLK